MSDASSDATHAVARAALGFVPFLGGPLQETYDLVFVRPNERRREETINDLVSAVVELELTSERLTELGNDDRFFTIALRAASAYQQTHREEKRRAIRNMLKNEVYRLEPNEDEVSSFFDAINILTPSHLALLDGMNDPSDFLRRTGKPKPNIYMGSFSHIVKDLIPEFAVKPDFLDTLAKDLFARGFTTNETLGGMVSESGLWQSRTSIRGKAFLQFISEPKQLATE